MSAENDLTIDAQIAKVMKLLPGNPTQEREPTPAEEIVEAALAVQIAETEVRLCVLNAARESSEQARGNPFASPKYWQARERSLRVVVMRHRDTLRSLTNTSNPPCEMTGDGS